MRFGRHMSFASRCKAFITAVKKEENRYARTGNAEAEPNRLD